MNYVFATAAVAAIITAIIFGPLVTDAIRGDGKTETERAAERAGRALDTLEDLMPPRSSP